MSTATAKLLSEFEALPVEEKQEFVREVIQHLPAWDSGPLNDDVAAAAGDALSAMLDEEERAS
jgi:predicted metallopeptidase